MNWIMGKYVTAKLVGAEDCRQGVVISVDPLRIRCGCSEEFACEGTPVVVTNPPATLCERCRSNLAALAEILEREGLTLAPE